MTRANVTLSSTWRHGISEDSRVFMLRVVRVIELPQKPLGPNKRETEKNNRTEIFSTSTVQTRESGERSYT